MQRDIRSPLSAVFLAWLIVGNLLWWFGPGQIQVLLGDGMVWSTLIPIGCLALLRPKRAAGVLAATLAGFALISLTAIERLGKAQSVKAQAKVFRSA